MIKYCLFSLEQEVGRNLIIFPVEVIWHFKAEALQPFQQLQNTKAEEAKMPEGEACWAVPPPPPSREDSRQTLSGALPAHYHHQPRCLPPPLTIFLQPCGVLRSFSETPIVRSIKPFLLKGCSPCPSLPTPASGDSPVASSGGCTDTLKLCLHL